MLIFTYNNYLELIKQYEEYRKLGSMVIDQYNTLEMQNKLFRMKLKQALEEINQLKASHSQTS